MPNSSRRFANGHWWQWNGTHWVLEPAPPGTSSYAGGAQDEARPPEPPLSEPTGYLVKVAIGWVGLGLLLLLLLTVVLLTAKDLLR